MTVIMWKGPIRIEPRSYVCGYCKNRVGLDQGWFSTNISPRPQIYICSLCGNPTHFDTQGKQFPGEPFGNTVGSLPADVAALYAEACSAVTANASTSAVLTCRKLLMHLAVEKGAQPGKSFIEYVEYLATKGYVPPGGEGWVDHIRKKGNEANHEIKIMSATDAKDLITFSEMLLRFIYEFPARVQPPAPAAE
jgi:hypothetical protein